MKKILNKIRYWLCKDYLNKHIKVYQNQIAIPRSDIIRAKNEAESNYIIRKELENMRMELMDSLVKDGMIETEEHTDDKLNCEIFKIRLRIWR